MTRKNTGSHRKSAGAKPLKRSPKATVVRNSAIPKPAARRPRPVREARPLEITHEMIARRAYEISQSPQCGSAFDNWIRAERELRST